MTAARTRRAVQAAIFQRPSSRTFAAHWCQKRYVRRAVAVRGEETCDVEIAAEVNRIHVVRQVFDLEARLDVVGERLPELHVEFRVFRQPAGDGYARCK